MSNILYIATQKNYSSWSLRAWLTLRWGSIAFDEVEIDLGQPGFGQANIAELKAVSPSGRLPALRTSGALIWDSLAIAEWAAEQSPGLWPSDPLVRASARSATAEMHSGFMAIRRDLCMNIKRSCQVPDLEPDTRNNLNRLFELWGSCRREFGGDGPWMFGTRSVVDAFFLPIATRLRTYGVPVDPTCQAYYETLLGDRDFLAWEAQCITDSWDRPGHPIVDGLYR